MTVATTSAEVPYRLCRESIETILRSEYREASRGAYSGREWTAQGLGMLRTYISPETRLHIWDSRLRTPGVTQLHTHPWDFESLVIAGTVEQYRFTRVVGPTKPDPDATLEPYYQQMLKCGKGGGLVGVPEACWLHRGPFEIYQDGETYRQAANETHLSAPTNGTVTLIHRTFGSDTEHAYVYWPHNKEWVSAEPRDADPDTVATVIGNALDRNFGGR